MCSADYETDGKFQIVVLRRILATLEALRVACAPRLIPPQP